MTQLTPRFHPEIFEVSLQKNDSTVLDLKSELDEEHGVGDADRLALYYLGVLLDNDLKIKDVISDDLGGNLFSVSLPKASQSVPAERFLIVGKDRKFKAIIIQHLSIGDLVSCPYRH